MPCGWRGPANALDENRMLLYWSRSSTCARARPSVSASCSRGMRRRRRDDRRPGQFLPVAERMPDSRLTAGSIRHAVGLAAEGVPTEVSVLGGLVPATRMRSSSLARWRDRQGLLGVDPSLLVVEVDRDRDARSPRAGRTFADQLASGSVCGLAIDDFGTGFASLSQLRHLHGEHLKIDMEFVRDITRNETDERLVRGIVGLAREFGNTMMAEGIEDQQEAVQTYATSESTAARATGCNATAGARRRSGESRPAPTGQPVPPIPWPRSGQRFRPSGTPHLQRANVVARLHRGGSSSRWPPTGEPTTRAAAIADAPARRRTSAT